MFNLPFFNKKVYKIKPVVLLVLDGFGIAPASSGNAITLAKTPNYDFYSKNFPFTKLIASGESVGLPANEVGNTEVGHLTLGAGRVILQDLERINFAIKRGTFFDNKAFLKAVSHVKSNSSRLHIMGLVSSGSVHAALSHLRALLEFCKREGVERVFLHLFTDGRDSPPNEGLDIITKIEDEIKNIPGVNIASVMGRYWAMDRDRRWDRTEKAYKAIVLGRGLTARSAEEAIRLSYSLGKTDEFIEPTIIVEQKLPLGTVDDNDALIFFNFRTDRSKQLTMAFTLPNFETLHSFNFGYDFEQSKETGEVKITQTFDREKVVKNLFFVTMTEYQKDLPVSAVAFGPEVVKNPLPEILAENMLRQAHMAESEKERFVKYYFNGLRETPFEREDDFIIPSPKVSTYDKKPEMSLPKLFREFIKRLGQDTYHFFIINFANPDMVGHTGNLRAAIKAVEFVDKYISDLIRATLKKDGAVFITADHGNVEEMLTYPSSGFFVTSSEGVINTDHSNNPVPLLIVSNKLVGRKIELKTGSLADVAPTILEYMGIPKPPEMTGKSLFF